MLVNLWCNQSPAHVFWSDHYVVFTQSYINCVCCAQHGQSTTNCWTKLLVTPISQCAFFPCLKTLLRIRLDKPKIVLTFIHTATIQWKVLLVKCYWWSTRESNQLNRPYEGRTWTISSLHQNSISSTIPNSQVPLLIRKLPIRSCSPAGLSPISKRRLKRRAFLLSGDLFSLKTPQIRLLVEPKGIEPSEQQSCKDRPLPIDRPRCLDPGAAIPGFFTAAPVAASRQLRSW